MACRSWFWLRRRIVGLLTRPSPVFLPSERDDQSVIYRPRPANRLQAALRRHESA